MGGVSYFDDSPSPLLLLSPPRDKGDAREETDENGSFMLGRTCCAASLLPPRTKGDIVGRMFTCLAVSEVEEEKGIDEKKEDVEEVVILALLPCFCTARGT